MADSLGSNASKVEEIAQKYGISDSESISLVFFNEINHLLSKILISEDRILNELEVLKFNKNNIPIKEFPDSQFDIRNIYQRYYKEDKPTFRPTLESSYSFQEVAHIRDENFSEKSNLMVETLEKERVNSYFALDTNLYNEKLENYLETRQGLLVDEEIELHPLSSTSNENFYTVGTIEISKENEIFLTNYSSYIKLNLSLLKEYALYSGMTVAANGNRLPGTDFQVKELFYNVNIEASECNIIQPGQFAVAFGPFYNSRDELKYSKFFSFLETANERYSTLILVGPFVDAENSEIIEGNCNFQEISEEDLSYEELLDKIIEIISIQSRMEVYIAPSLKEASNFYPLPLAPYQYEYRNLHMIGNPESLIINGLKVELIGYDVVMDIVRNYCIKSEQSVNKIKTATEHLLLQATSLPVIPSEFPVEFDYLENFQFEQIPDLVITTSRLGFHFQEFEGAVTVNCREFQAGFFTEISLQPGQPLNVKVFKYN